MPTGSSAVYLYNDFTQPISAKGVSGRVAILDETGREIATAPLKSGGVPNALDARFKGSKVPLNLKLKVRFTPADKERVFDFAFAEPSKEPAPRRAAAAAAQRSSSVASIEPATSVVQIVLPTTPPELLAELTRQNDAVRMHLEQGALGLVWFPAMTAKEIALALESHAGGLSAEQRARASNAVKRLVVAAWQIDAFGDRGNKQQVTEAYEVFAAAVRDIQAAYAPGR